MTMTTLTKTTQRARIAFFLVVLVSICDDASSSLAFIALVVAGKMTARPLPNVIPVGGACADKKKRSLPPVMIFQAKKKKWNDDEKKEEGGTSGPSFKTSPGTILIAPFVLLLGLDLLANIAVLTKRSIEVALTGEYTVWNPFQ
jgi:hypothetical protein